MSLIWNRTNRLIKLQYVPGIGPVVNTIIRDSVYMLQNRVWVELSPWLFHKETANATTQDKQSSASHRNEEFEAERKQNEMKTEEKKSKEREERKKKLDAAVMEVLKQKGDFIRDLEKEDECCAKIDKLKEDGLKHETDLEDNYFIARFRFH